MKLNKLAFISTLTIAALSSQVFAAENATVNFNARLVAATCDVSASKSLVSLGTHSIEKIADINSALAESKFNLVLNNCTKIYSDEASAATAKEVSILAAGEVLTGHSDLFADADASQVGVKLKAGTTDLLPNTETTINNLKIVSNNDYIVEVTAGLYATTKNAVAQNLNVPVTFSVAYD
ncbi:fimbrial protein [Providencia sneebia]|uniref:Fimbrial subunit n=1 Tax=Providencia sneebia DSM 19967 TaxID=1141660 RepID=K8WLL2_9GAMM|nr:fimbrial protein [Providencia sneebia]EKT60851.1 fimbrial subunit [Providencia sneebia DSM 19967]